MEKINELLKQLCESKTPVFVNGLGIGKIKEVKEEYISFEIVKEEEKQKKHKVNGKMENYTEKTLFKETTYIPIAKIDTISEGEKEIPKTEEQSKIDDDLGGL